MRRAETKSIAHQIQVVLLSYLTRPGIRWAVLALAAGLVGIRVASAVAHWLGSPNFAGSTWTELLGGLSILSVVCGIFGLAIMFMVHARHQLMGTPPWIIPNTRQANLIVAAGIVPVLAGMMTASEGWGRHNASTLGVFSICLAGMILVGYAVCRPLLIPILIVAVVIAFKHQSFSKHLDEVATDYEWIYSDLINARLLSVDAELRGA